MFVGRKCRHLAISQRFVRSQVTQPSSQKVRVRFAPSPTGYLHLGGLRTALYNYLYANNMGGKFILRIEDTDQTRLVSGARESLIEDLLWSGIQIDEGPDCFGGQYGPYVQSERKEIYAEAVRKLLDNGTAYRCFCTERRLELLRKEALRTRQVPRYDNKCRHLTAQEQGDLLQRKMPFCIRFKLMDHTDSFIDLICGQVKHNVSDTEGDPVIMKSDDFPTYHFANVIDDHLMRITHVLRGVEWQISTTKHLLLYKAFGWQPPQFGHMPLLINADGTKLSKRQGDIGIKYFREKGYFPEALVNYVMSAGGGFEREQSQKLAIYSMKDLSTKFNISKVNAHPSRLNPEILDDFNRLKIKSLLANPITADQLVNNVKIIVKASYPKSKNLDLNEKHILSILKWSVKRITFLQDLTSANLSFLWVKPESVNLDKITKDQVQKLILSLESIEFSKDSINAVLKDFAKAELLKYAQLMKTLRSGLSGLKEGPGVAEMMEILGKEVVLERLSGILNMQQSKSQMSESA